MLKSKHLAKIVIVITKSDIGGAQNHVWSLINEFRHHYEIVLVAGSEGFLTDSVEALGIKVHFLFDLDSFNAPKAIFKLRSILILESPDLVHTHSSLASFYGRAATKLCGQKVLYTVHGWHFAGEGNPLKWCIKVGLELCARIFTDQWIAVSNFDLMLGQKFFLFKPSKVKVIANGVADVANRRGYKELRDGAKSLEVVFVGRSTYQKNCESALAVLRETKSSINLTMFASGGQISELQSAHARSPVRERVKLILNEPNAAMEMHKFDVMLVTSRYEGMPLGVIEAMRANLAIVSTNVCGMAELVIQGQNGYLYKEENISGMAKQLDEFAGDRGSLAKMGAVSRERYEDLFTLESMLHSTAAVYRKMLGK